LKEEGEIGDHRSMIKSCVLELKLMADLLHFPVLNLRSRRSLGATNILMKTAEMATSFPFLNTDDIDACSLVIHHHSRPDYH
jgi:hypothetical protein